MPWADPYYASWEWVKHTRPRILKRDNYTCYICGLPGANQVDHKTPRAEGGSDEDWNLAAIHDTPCHLNKTLEEAARGRARRTRRRPTVVEGGPGRPPLGGVSSVVL